MNATNARGLKKPDCEGFFFMRFSFISLQRRLSLTIRKLRPDWMPSAKQRSFRTAAARWREDRPYCVSREPESLTVKSQERFAKLHV
jgi:hypothetical protein